MVAPARSYYVPVAPRCNSLRLLDFYFATRFLATVAQADIHWSTTC